MRVLLLVAAAVLVASVAAAPSLPVCCKGLDGSTYASCTCLRDDVYLTNVNVPAWGVKRFHWVMTNWAAINVPDSQRPKIKVAVEPCVGNVQLYMQGPSLLPNPFPTNTSALWNATVANVTNSIEVSLVAAQYFITVYGRNVDSNFSIVAHLDASKYPIPGGNQTITVSAKSTADLLLAGDTMSMMINFNTADTHYGNEADYQYRVLKMPVVDGEPCGDVNITTTSECVLTSPCGAERLMERFGATPWMSHPPATNVSVEVPGLEQNQQYTFVVQVRVGNSSDYTAVYTGSRGTPTYTRVGQAASNTTIIIIACCSGGGFMVLVGCIVWAKTRLNRRMKDYRALKGKPLMASGAASGAAKGVVPGEGAPARASGAAGKGTGVEQK